MLILMSFDFGSGISQKEQNLTIINKTIIDLLIFTMIISKVNSKEKYSGYKNIDLSALKTRPSTCH